MNWKISKTSLALLFVFILPSCGFYSFTGASISPNVKTISIQTFFNNAPLGPSNMSVTFTEKIKDYYQQNTSLSLVENNGDLQLDGYISNYVISPVSANVGNQSQDFSDLSRITITISASYINLQDPTFDFDRKFSFFKDYETEIDLSSNEELFVEEIFDQIILDIFNSSVANW